jgi:hypothetical protein
MKILVLDTIHGGTEIARHLERKGHFADTVDVYRGREGIDAQSASMRSYDMMIAPVHLDPAYFLLRTLRIPCISHHDAVRWILGNDVPSPMIEISGARGKTTTAHALAHVMKGPGILHASDGTFGFPEGEMLWKGSITPASVIPAAGLSRTRGGWLIAEISLGYCGSGDLAVLTSGEDYTFAGGKRSALQEKIRSGQRMPRLVTPPGVTVPGSPVKSEEAVSVRGDTCHYSLEGIMGSFSNPLLSLDAYRVPLMLAATAAMVLGTDPSGLADFTALEGRMAIEECEGAFIVDNSNSGTNADTTCAAAVYLRSLNRGLATTLVIGQEKESVCEGFPGKEVFSAVSRIRPDILILVGDYLSNDEIAHNLQKSTESGPSKVHFCRTLEEGKDLATRLTRGGNIILAVKTWR